MKKVFKVVVYLFVITTLFTFNSNIVFATGTDEAEKVLNEIVAGGKNCKYESVNDSGTEVFEPYDAFILDDNVGYIDSNTGCVIVGEGDEAKSYFFQITTEAGDVVTKDNYFTLDEKGHYKIKLYEEMPEGPYTYSLVPIEDGEVISSEPVDKIEKGSTIKINAGSGEGGFWAEVGHLLLEIFCGITIPAGDSYLYMISSAIGEPVTIDKVVFGEVQKLSIDFFDGASGEITLSSGSKIMPLKNILKGTVNTWYSHFRNLVLAFYMAMLVYVGIKILLTSTANKKAMYKNILTAWVMGIAMLMFFPYVMKYAIKLNEALCRAVHEDAGSNTMGSNAEVHLNFKEISPLYGKDGFVMIMLGESYENASDKTAQKEFTKTAVSSGKLKGDAMLNIRWIAAQTVNLPLVIVYFILIGELLALLVMYYKRVFMLAFLITIFPIVMATYPLNKIGDIKMNSFGVWFKEFLINVFVQSFHAVTYRVVVQVGITSYFEAGNWLFMIMCILFLFEGEKIIRGIFGAKSSINSIGDMAASGMMAMNIARSATKFIPNLGGAEKDKKGNPTKKAAADRKAARTNPGANTPGAQANASAVDNITNATNAGNSGNGSGDVGGSGTSANSASSASQTGGKPGATNNSANEAFNERSSRGKSKFDKVAGAIGGGVSAFSQVAGGIAGFTFGMAQNDGNGPSGLEKGFAEATKGASMGKAVGMGAYNIATGAVGRVVGTVSGLKLAGEYSSGEHDDEIFTNADKALDDAKKEALRKAYAKAARRKGAGFENSADIQIIKARVDQSKR